MGYEGFSGQRVDPAAPRVALPAAEVGEFTPLVLEEWVPDTHVHRLTAHARRVAPEGDPITGRKVLMFNGDVEMGICKPVEQQEAFFRCGEGDEVLFVQEGSGDVETTFGTLPFRQHDYVVIPRGTTYRVAPATTARRRG